MRPCKRYTIPILSLFLFTVVFLVPSAGHAQGKVYTLKQCIDKALGTNLSVVQAKDYYRQAKANVLAAKGAFLPDLNWNLNGYFEHSRRSGYTHPITGQYMSGDVLEDNQYYSAKLDVSLLLFDGFGLFYNLAGSKAQLASYGHQISQQELNTVYSVKSQYFSLLQAQSILEIRQKALERSQELMKIAQTKYEVGSASLSDVLKAKVSLSQAQLDLLITENSVKTAQANLNYAIGERIDQEIAVKDVEMSVGEYTLEQVNDYALDNNPDYLSAQSDCNSAKYSLKYAQSNYSPTLTVSGAKQWTDRKIENVDDWWSRNYNAYVYASLNFNIFNRFQTRKQTETAKANLHTAEYQLNDAKRAIELEVREAYLNLQEKSKARELSEEKFASADEDYKLAHEKYKLGAATILDILDAELSLKTAESDQIESKYNYYLAIARLQKVMGLIE